MVDEHVFDLLPGYALGCLDEDDLLRVARHLTECPACRNELASFWPVVEELPHGLALQAPPPHLKEKILLRAAGKVPTPPMPVAEKPVERVSLAGWLRALAARPLAFGLGALALLLIVFLVGSNLVLWQQVEDLRARIPGEEIRIVEMAGTQNAPQAQGYLMVFNGENYGTLVVEHVPQLEPQTQYQLWLIKNGQRTSGGVFSVGKDGYGVLEVSTDLPLETYGSFGITIEPQGGSPGPTGAKILGGDL